MIKVFVAASVAILLAVPAASAEHLSQVSTPGIAVTPGADHSPSAREVKGHGDSAASRCLLPPRLARLGQSAVFLAPSRPIEAAALACLKRGGTPLTPSS